MYRKLIKRTCSKRPKSYVPMCFYTPAKDDNLQHKVHTYRFQYHLLFNFFSSMDAQHCIRLWLRLQLHKYRQFNDESQFQWSIHNININIFLLTICTILSEFWICNSLKSAAFMFVGGFAECAECLIILFFVQLNAFNLSFHSVPSKNI